jgi:quercetin dioxygenase-like cupin family protein
MKLARIFSALVLLLTLALLPSLQLKAASNAAPVTRYMFKAAGLQLPDPFEISIIYASATPGGATAIHHHPGLLVGTILEGELTYMEHATGKITRYATGQTLVEQPNSPGMARNDTGQPNFLFATVVLPKGVPYSTPETGSATPANPYKIVFQNRVDGKQFAGDYEVVTFINDFAPGAQTPVQTYGGQAVTTPLDGDLSFVENGVEKVYKAGQTYEQIVGEYSQLRNTGSTNVRAFVTALLPKGKTLVTTQIAGAPSTGEGRGGGSPSQDGPGWSLYLALGLAVMAIGSASLLILRRSKKPSLKE